MYGNEQPTLGASCCASRWASAAPALAQEFQPYPSPKVTVEQYVAYAKQVQDSLGETARDPEGHEPRRVLGHAHADVLHLHDQGLIRPIPRGSRARWTRKAARSTCARSDTSRARKPNSPSCSATTRSGTCSSRKKSSGAISDVGCSFQRLRSLSYTSGLPHRLTPPTGLREYSHARNCSCRVPTG